MMFLNDIEPQFIKAISYLYASDNLVRGQIVPLQFYLEEAIKNKSGVTKDLTNLVSSSLKQRGIGDYKPAFISTVEESKGSNSDEDLELDLFKEDLMCIICNGMEVGAGNRLLECSDCHKLYHEECHKPSVFLEGFSDSWVCQSCKDSTVMDIVPVVITDPTNIHNKVVPSSSPSSSHRQGTSSPPHSSNAYKYTGNNGNNNNITVPTTMSDKYPKSITVAAASIKSSVISTSSNIPKPLSTSSSSVRNSATPNPSINIISADKRIQIMKKKAAKLQEKRKHLPR